MILTMAWKTLVAHPVRTAVLGVGFGLGVAVMATLLGVGEVVLDQARAPVLAGGGQLVVSGITGAVTSARAVIASAGAIAAEHRIGRAVASPRKRADLFLVRNGKVVPVRARGGIPSLERALGDPETSRIAWWTDTDADAAWASPDPGAVVRAMDRFHAIPEGAARASSWAEWLYFKGQSGTEGQEGQEGREGRDRIQFYVTFIVGPRLEDGRRPGTVRLQLDRNGRVSNYSDAGMLDESAVLASAPDLVIGHSRVRLEGMRYHLSLDLRAEAARSKDAGAVGDIFIDAVAGRSLPPFTLRGAGGWESGYTVPVMSGQLSGALTVDGARVTLGGAGYHDHNWGFWEGVTWRWGQVQHEGLSYVYGRVFPPADAADADRVPGFLLALGPDGPVGYASRVSIDETNDPATGRPRRIVVSGRSGSIDLTFDITVEGEIATRWGAVAGSPNFLQLRARYHVTGRAGSRTVDFTAQGAAETFRGGGDEERKGR